MIALLAHLTAEDKTDIKIGLTALFVLGVFRVACWAYDTRNDFERPLRHGSMNLDQAETEDRS